MARESKYSSWDAPLPRELASDRDAIDKSAMAGVIKAGGEALAALADTLNALTLRIALARTAGTSGSESYDRLARLAASASDQVRGIQHLLGTMEEAVHREESSHPKRSSRRS